MKKPSLQENHPTLYEELMRARVNLSKFVWSMKVPIKPDKNMLETLNLRFNAATELHNCGVALLKKYYTHYDRLRRKHVETRLADILGQLGNIDESVIKNCWKTEVVKKYLLTIKDKEERKKVKGLLTDYNCWIKYKFRDWATNPETRKLQKSLEEKAELCSKNDWSKRFGKQSWSCKNALMHFDKAEANIIFTTMLDGFLKRKNKFSKRDPYRRIYPFKSKSLSRDGYINTIRNGGSNSTNIIMDGTTLRWNLGKGSKEFSRSPHKHIRFSHTIQFPNQDHKQYEYYQSLKSFLENGPPEEMKNLAIDFQSTVNRIKSVVGDMKLPKWVGGATTTADKCLGWSDKNKHNLAISREFVNGYWRYYLCVTVFGIKPNNVECGKGEVGLDLGVHGVAFATKDDIQLEDFSSGKQDQPVRKQNKWIHRTALHYKISVLQTKMVRLRDVAISEAKKTKGGRWRNIVSPKYYRLQNLKRKLEKKRAVSRKQSHNVLCKEIRRVGHILKVDQTDIKSMQMRKKDVDVKGKKRQHGRSIQNYAPGIFLSTLKQMFERTGGEVKEYSAYDTVSTQTCPICGRKNEYMKDTSAQVHICYGCGHKMNRDMSSAVVLYGWDGHGINHDKCRELVEYYREVSGGNLNLT